MCRYVWKTQRGCLSWGLGQLRLLCNSPLFCWILLLHAYCTPTEQGVKGYVSVRSFWLMVCGFSPQPSGFRAETSCGVGGDVVEENWPILGSREAQSRSPRERKESQPRVHPSSLHGQGLTSPTQSSLLTAHPARTHQ